MSPIKTYNILWSESTWNISTWRDVIGVGFEKSVEQRGKDEGIDEWISEISTSQKKVLISTERCSVSCCFFMTQFYSWEPCV